MKHVTSDTYISEHNDKAKYHDEVFQRWVVGISMYHSLLKNEYYRVTCLRKYAEPNKDVINNFIIRYF